MILKKEIITNFALPTMNFRIVTISSADQESSVRSHMEDFNKMSDIMKQHSHATVGAVEAVIADLSSIKNIVTIEVTNPANKNGFIYTLSNP
jgi:hypothetical protein